LVNPQYPTPKTKITQKGGNQAMKELKSFEELVLSLEKVTREILSSEEGFSRMPRMLREDLAERLGRVRLYLLFARNHTKEVTHGKIRKSG
jgi:hypothetical protein